MAAGRTPVGQVAKQLLDTYVLVCACTAGIQSVIVAVTHGAIM